MEFSFLCVVATVIFIVYFMERWWHHNRIIDYRWCFYRPTGRRDDCKTLIFCLTSLRLSRPLNLYLSVISKRESFSSDFIFSQTKSFLSAHCSRKRTIIRRVSFSFILRFTCENSLAWNWFDAILPPAQCQIGNQIHGIEFNASRENFGSEKANVFREAEKMWILNFHFRLL